MNRAAVILALFAAAIASACAVTIPPPAPAVPEPPAQAALPVPAPVSTPSTELEKLHHETGSISWYGRELQGKKMADGETFAMESLSASHRTLPLGTVIRVTNLSNNRTIDLRVSDRGPFVRTSIAGLSYGAARALDFVQQGAVRARVETLAPVRSDGIFTVQAAAFVEEENARTLKGRLQTKFETVYIVQRETNIAKFYCVRVGLYPSEEKAGRIAAKLALDGLEPVVLRKD